MPRAPRSDCKLTRETLEAFMAALGDGTPPFLALAADRVGMRRGAVKEYMHQGDYGENAHPLIQEFARRAHEIKAKYVLKCMQEMITVDARGAARAAQLQWLVTRLERDELHINPNPGKEQPKEEPRPVAAAPKHDDAVTKAVVEDLAVAENVN